MSDLLVIADDLTGAADCGITCASHGLNSVVVMGDSAGEIDADVLCVDGNTRRLDPEKAAAETARLVRRYSGDQTLMLFKKLDSTLRGNIAAELAASLEARRSLTLGGDAVVAVLAPAFPATARTTSNGSKWFTVSHWRRRRYGRLRILPPDPIFLRCSIEPDFGLRLFD